MTKAMMSLILRALLIGFLAGCSKVEPLADASESGAQAATWPAVNSAVTRDPQLEQRIDDILAGMSGAQKVGQVIQPELRNITPEQVREFHIGSILNGGGSFPNGNKNAPVEDWLQLADSFYNASMAVAEGAVAIPIMWGTDAVHGHNNVIGATLFPHNIGLGAANNPELIRQIHEATAREVAVTGMDWNFAPTVAVARDDRWGRTYEAYAEDPELVHAYAGKAVEGLQGRVGKDFMAADHVLATAKHFVGDGGTDDGVDRGDVAIIEQALRDIHAPGYVSAIEAGVQTIMASFSSWRGLKLHGHRDLLTGVLKEQMGFDGLVVGDWNGHAFVDSCTPDSCAPAFNAGIDIFMVPDDWQALHANTLAQVESGVISRERLDDAVRRILRVKLRAGLFTKGPPSQRPFAGRKDLLGAPAHRAIARQAVRESLVLLKNDRQLLPLSRSSRVLVAGDGAHNIGKQSGGWTLTWQGTGNTREDFPGATSIYEGIAGVVEAAGGTVELSEAGRYSERPDVAIVVFGEDPYAEMQGDVSHLDYSPETDLLLLRRLRSEGVPVVSVFLTGRPLWINPELNASDAFVVAWLPGSEGAGVADLLFRDAEGGINHDFSGKLSFSWPATAVQTPLNRGQADYQPLFAYGYGLDYATADSNEPWLMLAEESGVATTDGTRTLSLFKDRPLAPWALMLRDSSRRALQVTGSSASLPGIKLQSMDRRVQEDSRRLQWAGIDEARVSLSASQRTDLAPYLEQKGALVMDVLVYTQPTASVMLGMECGQDCLGEIDVSSALQAAAPGSWYTVSVDLACLAAEGVDLSLVLTPFYLATAGELELALNHIRVEPEVNANVGCE